MNSKRKRKYNPNKLSAKCYNCQELGNLENLIRQKLPIKDKDGKELYQSFNYVYFCGESCNEKYKL